MGDKPKVLGITKGGQSQRFHVEHVQLQFSNGEERVFERVRSHIGETINVVMAIPLLSDNTMLLVREYGVGLEQYHIGFPKGLIDFGEQPVDAINRELMEEIHYGARKIDPLMTLAPSPAYLDSLMAVFVAQDLYPQQLAGDEPEPLELIEWQLDQADELLKHPEFIDSRSIAALLYFLRQRG